MINRNFKSIFYFFTFCFILLQSVTVCAIENTQIFNNISVKDGLPVSDIFTIDQDSTGLMWFGSINGIVRYNGYEMKLFRQGGSEKMALPDNQITSLVNDQDLGLWVGSYEGLTYIDTKTNESQLVDLGKSREVRCLLIQHDSLLWVGTSEGLIKLNIRTRSFKLYNVDNSKLGSNIVRSLYVDSDENIWVGTFDGLNLLTVRNEMFYFNLKGNYKPELKNNLVLEIQPFTKNDDSFLWIGTETGLVLFNRKTHQSMVYHSQNSGFGNEVVKCIFPLKNGQLYFGTDFGFYFFDSKTGHFQVSLHDPFNNYSLANNVVWDIFQDNAGIIWLATANGISQLNLNQSMFRFTPVYNRIENFQVGNQVNDIYCDNDETLWLATKNGVIAKYLNGETKTFTNLPNSKFPLVFNNINTIYGDHLGRIWIGSAGGINIWDNRNQKMYTITANFDMNRGLRSNYISGFLSASDGSFWVMTWGGGMYKAKGDFTNIDQVYFEYVGDFNTNVFSSDSKIWLANKKKIYTIELSTMKVDIPEKLNQHIDNEDVNSLLVSTKGQLWVGLSNQLLRYNLQNGETSTFEIFTGNENTINNLIEDFNGDIWGSTLTSIFKISTSNLQVESFPMTRGIPLDIFLTQSMIKSKNGEIHLGGNDGYISFDPNEIQKNTFQPRVLISGIRVNNRSVSSFSELNAKNHSKNLVPYSDRLILKYEQNSLSIHFAALHYGDPTRNIYAYKLEGYDKDWIYTSGLQNSATYSNLSPDKYLFKVKSTNNDGVWFENTTQLQIMVKPPVWASAYAIVIYFVILQFILILLFITYRNKVQFKEKINSITVEKEKSEELARSKQQFFTNISHEFRTPLNLILGPVQTILNKYTVDAEVKLLLSLVLKNSRRLLSLVNQLMDIRKIETNTLRLNFQPVEIVSFCREQFDLFVDIAVNRGMRFQFIAPDAEVRLISDSAKLESIIQNLLSNAFKFTSDQGQIILKLELIDEKRMRIAVSDSGIGISPEEQPHIFTRFYQGKNSVEKQGGYGIGLNLAKEYCELMNGFIDFKSELGFGTEFWIEIPLTDLNVNDFTAMVQEAKVVTADLNQKENVNHILGKSSDSIILLVDDHVDIIDFIKISLVGKYQFLTASNGKEALKILDKHKVDLIVSDVMMPEVNGLSLCERVKSNPKFSSIPIILLTAANMASQHIEGFRAGADDYLIKPFNTEILEARITSLLFRNKKVEEYIKQKLIVGNQAVEVESYSEKLLQETIQFINQHISDPEINIEKMCKAIGISHSSLYRKIKSQTGLTLNELIRQVKLKRAAQLIKSKKMTIAEIMDETGFSNHSYFAKCFKKEYQMSPREYAESK